MNELQIFRNETFGQVRTIARDGEPWFVAADVCRALDVSDTWNALQRLDDDEKGTCSISTPGGKQDMSIINEPGLYTLVLGSRKPEARAFKRWITHEVIPSIRKTGSYSATQPANDKLLRAQAMLMNAQTRQFKAIMQTISDKTKLAPVAVEVFGLKALEQVTGTNMGNYLPPVEKTYSATEVGQMLGVSGTKVGRIANATGIKTPENGIWVMDKSRHSAKEFENFRYNSRGVEEIRQQLKAGGL